MFQSFSLWRVITVTHYSLLRDYRLNREWFFQGKRWSFILPSWMRVVWVFAFLFHVRWRTTVSCPSPLCQTIIFVQSQKHSFPRETMKFHFVIWMWLLSEYMPVLFTLCWCSAGCFRSIFDERAFRSSQETMAYVPNQRSTVWDDSVHFL